MGSVARLQNISNPAVMIAKVITDENMMRRQFTFEPSSFFYMINSSLSLSYCCRFLITAWTGGLIEHSRSLISRYNKSRRYLCKLQDVPPGGQSHEARSALQVYIFMKIIVRRWMFSGRTRQIYLLILSCITQAMHFWNLVQSELTVGWKGCEFIQVMDLVSLVTCNLKFP